MEFRQIRYALAVARERSFTKAAGRVHISQSAVSEQVRLLELDIGFPLFARTPHGIDVTDRGRTFLYEAERVIGDLMSLADTSWPRVLLLGLGAPRRRCSIADPSRL